VLSQKHLYKVLEFPKHLQVSIIALVKLGSACAQDVAAVTGKARAVESHYLNLLAVMQIVRKTRHGSRVFFQVDLEALAW
jgi:hypothetical protein